MKKTIYFLSCFFILISSAFICSCNSSPDLESNDDQSIFEGDPNAPLLAICNDAWLNSKGKYEQASEILSNDLNDLYKYALDDDQTQLINNAINMYETNGIDYILDRYGISDDVFLAATYYSEHSTETDALKKLVTNFPDLTQSEIELVFDIYNFSILLTEYLPQSRAMTRSCGIAIGCTVLSCFSACSIGSVAGLCWWLVTYGSSLVSLVDACS